MSTSLPSPALPSAGLHHPAAVAAVVDQLSHTVQQLLLAALARAREVPPAALPLPTVPPVPPMPATRPPLAPAAVLSARESEVLQRIAAGDSNKQIARALALSPHTVKRHVANILDKLGLHTRGQAAA